MKGNRARFGIIGIAVSLLVTGFIISLFSSHETPPTLEEGIVRVQMFYNEQCDLRKKVKEDYTRVKEKMSRSERRVIDSLFLENRQMLDSSASMIAGAFPDSLNFDVRKNLLLSAMREMKQALTSIIYICRILVPYLDEDNNKKERKETIAIKSDSYESLLILSNHRFSICLFSKIKFIKFHSIS
ncbi:MAG: hypothetical protein WCW78_01815 [Candidatus Paceibacterota bacterium]|jgi:hypothetical protein